MRKAASHDAGSSPRVRGTHATPFIPVFNSRIIPACAGNTLRDVLCKASMADHPRVCGEHDAAAITACCRCGSSPRVRGTLARQSCVERCGWIIPACAGNTRARPVARRRITDHPRVCGEHRRFPAGGERRVGSSPRVRGTQTLTGCRACCGRIIPACAGNTVSPQRQP